MRLSTLMVGILLFCGALGGCAVRTYEIRVHPDATAPRSVVQVIDGRPDKQLYMNGIAFGGQSSLYPLAPVPPIEQALRAFIDAAVGNRGESSLRVDAVVTIEDIDIKNRVGFATADDLSCRIESTLRTGSSSTQSERRIRSFVRNQENRSPLVQTSAEVIARLCLAQHASDILVILAPANGG